MNAMSKAKLYFRRASPTILSCAAAIGVIGTTVMAVKATPKAMRLLETAADEKGEELTVLEVVHKAGAIYIPTVLVGLSTITCIVGINLLSKRNQASLASDYTLLSQSYRQYRKAANSIYGDDADTQIKAQMAKDTYISADGYAIYSAGMEPEVEKILCYDLYSKRYFTSTIASVLNAQYHVNRNLCLRGTTTINEFYEFMGIDKIELGDEIGWSMDELIEGGIMWLDFENSHTRMNDGMECCVITTLWEPNKFSFEG